MTPPGPWVGKYDAGVPATLEPYPDRTILDGLADIARERPDHPAILFKGATMSYGELERLSDTFAAALAADGVAKGDRVALLLPNCPQFMIAQYGAWKAGAIVCPMNPIYTEEELIGPLARCEAKRIVTLTPFYGRVKAVQAQTAIGRVIATNIKEYLPAVLRLLFTLVKEKKEGHRITLQPGDRWFQAMLAAHRDAARPAVKVSARDHATILASGGTSGTPKGVLGTHRNLVISGMQAREWMRPLLNDWTDILMLPLPLFHTYGNTGMQALAIMARAPLSLVPNPRDTVDLLKTINKVRPAFFCGVPTLYNSILNHKLVRAGKIDFSSIKLCFSGSAPLMAETKKRFEELTGGQICEGYSMTEAQMAIVANPAKGTKKVGSVGLPITDIEITIVDADDGSKAMPIGKVGEILFMAPQLMEGYWHNPDETREVLKKGPDGRTWLFSGDLGYLDEDSYLFIVDRKKDLMKIGGFQVWPREIEEVLAAHPAVAEVGVAGVKDPVKGEIAKAWVVLRPGATATIEELRAHCKAHLAPFRVPAQIVFATDLPKTMVGKVLRRKLVERHNAEVAALVT
jgi:long-chain acyl-CoA synthetase